MEKFLLAVQLVLGVLTICGMTVAVIGGLIMINAFLTKGCM